MGHFRYSTNRFAFAKLATGRHIILKERLTAAGDGSVRADGSPDQNFA
jgi:hypothetical protein